MTALIALSQNQGQGSMALRTFKGSRLDFLAAGDLGIQRLGRGLA